MNQLQRNPNPGDREGVETVSRKELIKRIDEAKRLGFRPTMFAKKLAVMDSHFVEEKTWKFGRNETRGRPMRKILDTWDFAHGSPETGQHPLVD